MKRSRFLKRATFVVSKLVLFAIGMFMFFLAFVFAKLIWLNMHEMSLATLLLFEGMVLGTIYLGFLFSRIGWKLGFSDMFDMTKEESQREAPWGRIGGGGGTKM